MKALIVEDDFTNRLLLQTFLARYGDCHVAVNGQEAVEAFRLAQVEGQPYDLICMDILMPEMDGHQAVRAIRDREKAAGRVHRARVIMTTASTDEGHVQQSFQDRCDAYLLKPIDLHRLLRELRRLGLVPL